MNIMAPNQANVDVYAKNTVNWEGILPLAGEYRIEIVSPPGVTPSNYKLEVTLTNAVGTAAPTPAPATTPVGTPAIR
jgi:hypothetical protein